MAAKVLRMICDNSLSYEAPIIYERHECPSVPCMFEDETIVFECADGLFMTTYQNVVNIWLSRQKIKDGHFIKRLSLAEEITSSNLYVIPPHFYEKYNIPVIFKSPKQFVYSDSQGTWITFDEHVRLVQLT